MTRTYSHHLLLS
uniref:Uncharacterized protein n=1 Tax=Arundo donax TaxID=35708 RepID=A0A0A9BTP2_ARUDO